MITVNVVCFRFRHARVTCDYLLILNLLEIDQMMFSLTSPPRCVPLKLNPDVNVFQRKFVNEVRRCEEMDRKLSK